MLTSYVANQAPLTLHKYGARVFIVRDIKWSSTQPGETRFVLPSSQTIRFIYRRNKIPLLRPLLLTKPAPQDGHTTMHSVTLRLTRSFVCLPIVFLPCSDPEKIIMAALVQHCLFKCPATTTQSIMVSTLGLATYLALWYIGVSLAAEMDFGMGWSFLVTALQTFYPKHDGQQARFSVDRVKAWVVRAMVSVVEFVFAAIISGKSLVEALDVGENCILFMLTVCLALTREVGLLPEVHKFEAWRDFVSHAVVNWVW